MDNFSAIILSMTAKQLRHIREEKGLTRKAFAERLGVSASAIVHWEGDARAIPDWVEEKLLNETSITLPLSDLSRLLAHAEKQGISFEELLAQAIQDYLDKKGGAQ